MKKSFSILLLLILVNLARAINENLLPTDKTVKIARKISHCVKKAARALFAPSNDVSVIVPNQTYYSDVLQETLDKLNTNGIVKIFTEFPIASKGESNPWTRESSYVVIDTARLRQLLQQSCVSCWSEYIIVTEGTMQGLKEFAEYLWNFGYSKVAFIRVQSNSEIELVRLIRDSSLKSSSATLVTYDLCNGKSVSSDFGNNQEASNIVQPFSFLLNIPVNSTLKYSAILGDDANEEYSGRNISNHIEGLGVEIMNIFAAKYNIEMIQHTWENYQESNWTDVMFRCAAGEMDFFYSHFPSSNFYSLGLVDAVAWHKFETITFVDKLTFEFHLFTGLLHAYEVPVWICTCSLLSVISVFAYCIDLLSQRGLIVERFGLLTIWSVFAGHALPRLPLRFSLRFVTGMWILHNLVISNVYTAVFGSDLTAPHEGHRLQTFEDILESEQPICVGEAEKEFFNDEDDPVLLEIYERLEVTLPENTFDKILYEEYIGSRHLDYVQEHNWKNRRNDSLRVYSITESVILSYPSFIYARRHHPYCKKFSKLVSNIRETGLIEYLQNQNQGKVDEMTLYEEDDDFLELKHLVSIFLMLGFGLLMSGIVFAFELYTHKRSLKKRNTRG